MGLGPNNGKKPITAYKGSWAESVRNAQNNKNSPQKSKEKEECSACHGAGRYWYNKEICITCGGSGKW